MFKFSINEKDFNEAIGTLYGVAATSDSPVARVLAAKAIIDLALMDTSIEDIEEIENFDGDQQTYVYFNLR